MLSVLEYISHFPSQAQQQYKVNIGRSSLSLVSHYLIFILCGHCKEYEVRPNNLFQQFIAKHNYFAQICSCQLCLAFCYLLLSVDYFILLRNWSIPIAKIDCLALPHILCNVHMYDGILKFKPTIKNCHAVNCIIHCKVWVCAFSVQLLIIWSSKQVSP